MTFRKKILSLIILVLLFSNVLVETIYSQAPQSANLNGFKFLIGEWIGEGSGVPGEAKGSNIFTFELQNTVIIRKNHTEYPPKKDGPGLIHDDLLVIFNEGQETKATYYDNEGHVIYYTGSVSKDTNSVAFVSASSPGAPRFRLTYTRIAQDKLDTSFDVAPPGKPESFTKYVGGILRKNN